MINSFELLLIMGSCASKKHSEIGNFFQAAENTFSIDIKNRYEFFEYLGSGHYGTVSRAVSLDDRHEEFAIKKINKEVISNPDYLRNEVSILAGLHHPNIIKIYETYENPISFYMVMQYCSGGTLQSRIANNLEFTERNAAIIMKQIIRAIRYLHRKGIVHRDVKPENFLYHRKKENSKLKLIDFGLSQKQGKWFKSMSDVVGTPYYLAPELIQGKYNEKCDVWSIGVIMYLLIAGKLPFYDDNSELLMYKIKYSEITYFDNVWYKVSNNAKDLIHKKHQLLLLIN